MPRKYTSPRYEFELPWWVYDAAIVLLLLVLAGAQLIGQLAGMPTLAFVSGLAFLVIVYGSFIEPRWLRVKRYVIGEGPHHLKAAFISDTHVGPYKGTKWMEKVVRAANALSPDVILLGGDFLYKDARDLPKLAPLKGLKAPLGVFGILGNHDECHSPKEAKAWFAEAGIPLLLNESVRVPKGGWHVAVVGADDDWYGETDLELAFARVMPEDIALVMLHNPDLAPPAAAIAKSRPGPTVFFSGHTHGGQIRLPLLGSVWQLPHHLGRGYDLGYFLFPTGQGAGSGIPYVIGAGTGESGPRARLLCPPEIVLVELRY